MDLNGTATILPELECPVCTDYMHPPIRQCVIGHSFCNECYEKVDNCPTCRNPKGTARSYALESLHEKLSFPCKNKIDGCNEIILGSKIKEHEKMCPYSPLDCPLKVINNCEWRGHLIDVITHCKSNHPQNVYTTSEQKLTCSNFLKRQNNVNCDYYYILFKAFNEIFKVNLQINFETGIMKWCVFHLGSDSQESAMKYSYEIEIENRKLNKQNISLKSSCQPIKANEDTFSNEHCLMTHCDMIKKFCIDDDFLYTVKIYKNNNDNQSIVQE